MCCLGTGHCSPSVRVQQYKRRSNYFPWRAVTEVVIESSRFSPPLLLPLKSAVVSFAGRPQSVNGTGAGRRREGRELCRGSSECLAAMWIFRLPVGVSAGGRGRGGRHARRETEEEGV